MRRPRPNPRRLKPEIPEVPTASAPPAPAETKPPADPEAESAEAEIRKMVEAAYT